MAMNLQGMEPGLIGLATQPFAVVINVTYATPARYLYVGTGGDVALVALDDSVVVFKSVPSGGYIFCASKRVDTAGTTASDIVGHI